MWVPSTFQWNLIACVVVQRPSPCPVTGPVEISPKLSRSGFRQVAQSDRLEIGIRDRIHFGMLTGLIPESCPPSPGIRSDSGWERQLLKIAFSRLTALIAGSTSVLNVTIAGSICSGDFLR